MLSRMRGKLLFWELRRFDSRRKSMKNSNFSRYAKLFALSMFVCALALTGCKKPTDSTDETTKPVAITEADSLIGTWSASAYESYIITKDSFESVGTYKGDSLVVLKTSETAGTIFVKYSVVYDWDNPVTEDPNDESYLFYPGNPEWGTVDQWYPLNEALMGKWYAINYKNLTANSISISGAYSATGKKATDTLDEAVTEFTIDNGYFEWYSECVKSE